MIATAPPAEHVRETWEERRERLASSYADALGELAAYVRTTQPPSRASLREMQRIVNLRRDTWLVAAGSVP